MIDIRYMTSEGPFQTVHVFADPESVDAVATSGRGADEPESDRYASAARIRLPVLALRGMVVFPGVAAPIAAGREKTLRAIEMALEGDKQILAVAQRDAVVEEPTPDGLFRVGTISRIAQMQRVPGGIQLVIQGLERGGVLEFSETEGRLEAVCRPLPEMLPLDPEASAFAALYKEVRERATQLSRLRGVPKEIVEHLLGGVSGNHDLADLVAFYTELEVDEKQELLETLSVEDRLRKLLLHLQRQIGVLEAQEQIRSKVQEELGERQREIFLREQVKAIQKELGDDVDSLEVAELRERIEGMDLPEEARREVDRELRRLERIPRESAEAQVVRTYLETVADLPWSTRTEDRIDLQRAEEILERDHYGLTDVKERVLDFLAVRQLQQRRRAAEEAAGNGNEEAGEPAQGETEEQAGESAEGEAGEADTRAGGHVDDRIGSTLLFIGPPGVGKTSIAQSIAEAMGRKYVRVSLGGARDEADIRGHRRTYVGALPGRIVSGIRRAGTMNPVFLLDEVDKLGVSFQGDPSAALMEVLDPEQNNAFVDHYLGVPFDLSDVMFIATANVMDQIPGPLRDRMEAIEFRGYTEAEKQQIARRYLLPRQLDQNGLDADQLEIDDEAIRTIITVYTREAGVRNLERELGAIARKAARRIASDGAAHIRVSKKDLRGLLGRKKVHPERKSPEDTIGVATGMYYTPAGGDIMLVESSVMKGKDNLVLTGQLGDVMKESARAALTYARSHAEELGIPADMLQNREIHIHVPAGAVPKEGPSAGIAMSCSLISALSGRPVRHDVAMTGELTLTGRILPIGGLKEKVLGAQRAGISAIIMPADNEGDLEELPEQVRASMHFERVSTLDEALRFALRDRPQPKAQRKRPRSAGGRSASTSSSTSTPASQ